MKKFYVIVPLAAIIVIAIYAWNSFRAEMYYDYKTGEEGLHLRYRNEEAWIETQPGWDPCQGIDNHRWWKGYEVYFVAGPNLEFEAQLYDRKTSKLLATTTVLWYSSEPYTCSGEMGIAEGYKDEYFVNDILAITLGDLPLGGFPYDELYDKYPVLLKDTHPEYRNLLDSSGDWDVIYIPQQERIILLLDGRIIATGKITKP